MLFCASLETSARYYILRAHFPPSRIWRKIIFDWLLAIIYYLGIATLCFDFHQGHYESTWLVLNNGG